MRSLRSPLRGSERGGRGLRVEEGRIRWFGLTVVEHSAGKVPDPRPVILASGDFSTVFMA